MRTFYVESRRVLTFEVEAESDDHALDLHLNGQSVLVDDVAISTAIYEAEPSSEGAPPYDAATATGMYDLHEG